MAPASMRSRGFITALLAAAAILVSLRVTGGEDTVLWTFDRVDALGGFKTTILGNPRVIDAPVGKAIEFDGIHDALFVDTHPLAGAETWTWEAVFRPDGGAAEQRWFHLQETGSDHRMLFEIRVVDGRWCLDAYVHSATGDKALIDRRKLHELGRWYHVAAVYDGQTFRNYVNGVEQGAAEIRLTPQGPGRTSIGVRLNLVNYFKGAIHAARFTRRALVPSEFLASPGARARRRAGSDRDSAQVRGQTGTTPRVPV